MCVLHCNIIVAIKFETMALSLHFVSAVSPCFLYTCSELYRRVNGQYAYSKQGVIDLSVGARVLNVLAS